jgi:hypothetical protein
MRPFELGDRASKGILETARSQRACEGGEMVYLPWWVLLAGLAASAFAAYVLLGRTQAGDSPWVLFPLTAALGPVIFLGAAVAGITLSVLLSMLLEDRMGAPTGPTEPPSRTERTGTETLPEGTAAETTLQRTVPTPSTPSASSSASPSASPTASASASPSP